MKSKLDLGDEEEFIDHKKLQKLCSESNVQFNLVIKESKLYFAPKIAKIPTKEYTEMMDQARKIIQQKEYLEMTREFEKDGSQSEQLEWNTIKRHMIAILNVFFSVIACFVAVFYLGEMAHLDVGIRILLSMSGAFVVIVAEGWFFTKDLISSDYWI